MKKRFATSAFVFAAAAGLSGCGHLDATSEASPAPVYRPQDLLEATSSVGRHLDTDDRLTALETQMTVMKVEMGRLSGAAQRIEARQIQSGGIAFEPPSSRAAAVEEKPVRSKSAAPKHAATTAPPPVKLASAAPQATETPAPAAAVESHAAAEGQSHNSALPASALPAPAPAQAPPAPEAAVPSAAELQVAIDAKSKAPPAAEHAEPAPPPATKSAAPPEKAAGHAAGAVPEKAATAPAPVAALDTGFGLQLAAYGSAERASAAWDAIKDKGGPLLADLLPKREEAQAGGRTVYRLKVGPLPDAAAAKARCDGLKSQGLQCVVTAFSGDWP